MDGPDPAEAAQPGDREVARGLGSEVGTNLRAVELDVPYGTGRQALEGEQRQFEAVVGAHLLEEAGQVDLDGAFGDAEGPGDLLILKALRQQRDELTLPHGQRHRVLEKQTVAEGLVDPKSAGTDLAQHVQQRAYGQGLGKNAANADGDGLGGKFRGEGVGPEDDGGAGRRGSKLAEHLHCQAGRSLDQEEVYLGADVLAEVRIIDADIGNLEAFGGFQHRLEADRKDRLPGVENDSRHKMPIAFRGLITLIGRFPAFWAENSRRGVSSSDKGECRKGEMRILIADDDRSLRTLLLRLLPSWGYDPVAAETGDEAWEILQGENAPQFAILDWMMPGLDGIGLCRLVRARRRSDYTYLILLTSKTSPGDMIEALEAGADDFVAKPFHPFELRARLRPGRRILELERELALRANYDSLTGLPNRCLLEDRFTQAAERAKRNGEMVALLYIDMDDFKRINDRYGHLQGDFFLKEFATRLRASVRQSDTLARIGGDEFVLLAPGLRTADVVAELLEKVLRATREPIALEGGAAQPLASVGVSLYPRDGADLRSLQQHADAAMYQSKRLARECVEAILA